MKLKYAELLAMLKDTKREHLAEFAAAVFTCLYGEPQDEPNTWDTADAIAWELRRIGMTAAEVEAQMEPSE